MVATARGVHLPVTETISQEVISLPMHSHLTDAEVETVASSNNAFERERQNKE